MLVELARELGIEVVDGLPHRDYDRDQPTHGVPVGLFDAWRLPKRRCVQVGENLLNQGWVIAAAGAPQQGDHAPAGQPLPCRLVFEVRKSLQRLRIELEQNRPQSADSLM